MTVPSQPQPPFAQAHAARTEESTPTRHLSAAAYLDEGFRQASLREVYHQARRVVAPSYGFRLVPVLWHCLRARKAATARDSSILALLLLSACVSPFLPVLVAVNLAILQMCVALWQVSRDVVARVRASHPVPLQTVLAGAARVGAGLLGLVFLAVLAMVFWGAQLLARLSAPFSGPTAARDDGGGFGALFGGSLLLTVMVVAISVGANLWTQRQLERLVPGVMADNPHSPRLSEIERQQHGNTTVYSGYRPFVGAGAVIDTWGFAQRLVRASDPLGTAGGEQAREFPQVPFLAEEIIAHVRTHLAALADNPGDRDPGRPLAGMTVEDRVFLAGTEVSELSPVTGPDQMRSIIHYPISPARHYLTCRVTTWRGEIVTSVHVHFAVQGRSLYLEITTTALPPCHDAYRIVDQVDGTGPAAYWRAFVQGIAYAPRIAATSPVNVVRAIADATTASQGNAPAQVAWGLDYGARFSVRELGSAEVTRNHVQTQDILKHKRIIERRVIAAAVDFLADRGVDTSEFRQRALTILNAGAVNTGSGSVYVESAVGQQNQAPPARPTGR